MRYIHGRLQKKVVYRNEKSELVIFAFGINRIRNWGIYRHLF